MPGKLYVLNVDIGGDPLNDLPLSSLNVIRGLDLFLAERGKTCRAFLKKIDHPTDQSSIEVFEIDKHQPEKLPTEFFDKIQSGKDGGVISEAGSAGVLDAGTRVVKKAHSSGIEVSPLIGPSSVILGLMASGLGGNDFTVHGYLPIKFHELKHFLHQLEKESERTQKTQVFIETPYRNLKLYESLCKCLKNDSLLCIAAGLTTEDQFVLTRPIREWKKMPAPPIHKVPAIFILQAH